MSDGSPDIRTVVDPFKEFKGLNTTGKASVIGTAKALRALSREARAQGRKIVLVPTMGALHEGHMSLIRAGRRRAGTRGLLIVSIFVNPTQFSPGEDLDRYPRPLDVDLQLCSEAGVDAVFVPSVREMYPDGYSTYVEVNGLTECLCGKCRPGHFRGVATVVLKLLLAAIPHVALFGNKDYQQLLVVKRMVEDMGLDAEIVGLPIVREVDGLAMSSRNQYLNGEARTNAVRLYQGLQAANRAYAAGEKSAEKLVAAAREVIEGGNSDEKGAEEQGVKIQYLELRDSETLAKVVGKVGQDQVVMLVAAYVDNVRLIDNMVLSR